MTTLQHKDLLDAGVHFGHLTRKWNPNMAPYIFMERKGIHIIDLNKTLTHLEEAAQALKNIAHAGRKILFVGTKKQAKEVIEQAAKKLKMPYVTERWLGGTLTNFATIRKLLKKMSSYNKFMKEDAYKNMAKKEQLMISREKAKLERLLQGIADVTRLPAALFVVDIKREHIAVREAHRLGIPVFAIADTNANPLLVDYPIPGNDDAARSIQLIVDAISSAIAEGLAERQQDKDVAEQEEHSADEKEAIPAAKAKESESRAAQPKEGQPKVVAESKEAEPQAILADEHEELVAKAAPDVATAEEEAKPTTTAEEAPAE